MRRNMPRQCVAKVHIPTDVMEEKQKGGYRAHNTQLSNTDLTYMYKYNRSLRGMFLSHLG